jgi:hypothetical protein
MRVVFSSRPIFHGTMGSPAYGTPAYYKKLAKTKHAKALKRRAAIAQKPVVKSIVQSSVRKTAAKSREQVEKAKSEAQKERGRAEQGIMRANKYYRTIGKLKAENRFLEANQNSVLRDEVQKLRSDNSVLEAMRRKQDRILRSQDSKIQVLERELAKANAEVAKGRPRELVRLQRAEKQWTVFWGHLRAQGRPGTVRWLQQLWAKGPPRAPDRCWGGGQ